MVEEKIKSLEAKIMALISENERLKSQLSEVKQEYDLSVRESQESISNLQNEAGEMISSLKEENDLIQARNSELTTHLKKIMSRLESLGMQ